MSTLTLLQTPHHHPLLDLMTLRPQPELATEKLQPKASRKSIFPFLQLPLELRLEIYAYLLILPENAVYNYNYYTHRANTAHTTLCPQILLVNWQINCEATDLLYKKNTFLAHPSLLTAFPRLPPLPNPVSSQVAASQIRRVRLRLRLDWDLPFKAEDVKSALSGMERVEIQIVQKTFLGVGCGNLKVLEGVRGVGEVKIWGSTTGFEKYVHWLEETMMKPAGEAEGDTYGDRYDEGLVERLHLCSYL